MPETARPDDEALTAFLDGEMPSDASRALLDRLATEAPLRQRLGRLYDGGRDIPQALDALLDAAPTDHLDRFIDDAIEAAPTSVPILTAPPRRRAPWQSNWLRAAVAAVLLIAAGSIGYALRGVDPGPPETWKQAVAEYWALTTADTLALNPSADAAALQLATVGDRLGLPLSPEAVGLSGPTFRAAQIFDFRGRPLAQIAYLDPDYGPVAYCVIADPDKKETAPAATELDGFDVVHWSSGGFARMLIGRAPPERLRQFADQLIERSI